MTRFPGREAFSNGDFLMAMDSGLVSRSGIKKPLTRPDGGQMQHDRMVLTGAAGFHGSHLCERLRDGGAKCQA